MNPDSVIHTCVTLSDRLAQIPAGLSFLLSGFFIFFIFFIFAVDEFNKSTLEVNHLHLASDECGNCGPLRRKDGCRLSTKFYFLVKSFLKTLLLDLSLLALSSVTWGGTVGGSWVLGGGGGGTDGGWF